MVAPEVPADAVVIFLTEVLIDRVECSGVPLAVGKLVFSRRHYSLEAILANGEEP